MTLLSDIKFDGLFSFLGAILIISILVLLSPLMILVILMILLYDFIEARRKAAKRKVFLRKNEGRLFICITKGT